MKICKNLPIFATDFCPAFYLWINLTRTHAFQLNTVIEIVTIINQ